MSIGNYNLPFDVHNNQNRDIRNRLSKLAQSDIRPFNFEQSEGIRPAEYYAPFKYLPVAFKDVGTEDYVVLPKGRIVSAITGLDSSGTYMLPVNSGSIYAGHQATEAGGSAIQASVDKSYFGYDEFISALLVPANGGAASSGFYTSADVTAQTLKANGAIAAAGDMITYAANAPVGVTFHDWYQDIRGKYLNYTMWPDGGHVLTDWFIEVPFCTVDDQGSYNGVEPAHNGTYANTVKWFDINSKFTYLQYNQDGGDVFKPGVFTMSDAFGNYKIQGGSSAITQNKTVQTVGKILSIDSRFPKGSLEDVQTYPRSGMPGTQTAGIPKYLFDFVYQCIKIGTGSTPTVEDIYNAVRSGNFGMVRIQLHVS